MIKKLIIFAALLFIPVVSFANGGDQRVVDNKYFINLSRAPFTPRVGVKTSFLASFVDVEKNKLIAEDLVVRVRIGKQGDVMKGNPQFEQDNIAVHGGVLELPYTFEESGFHEIFFDFAFASNPQRIYEVPDFLIDVQKIEQDITKETYLISMILGVLISFGVGWLIGHKKRTYLRSVR